MGEVGNEPLIKRPIERTEEHIAPKYAQKNRRSSTVAWGQVDLCKQKGGLGLT